MINQWILGVASTSAAVAVCELERSTMRWVVIDHVDWAMFYSYVSHNQMVTSWFING